MNKYSYYINNVEVAKKEFLQKLATAFQKEEIVSDFISIGIPDYEKAEKKIRQMQNTAKKSLTKKSQILIIKNISFRVVLN